MEGKPPKLRGVEGNELPLAKGKGDLPPSSYEDKELGCYGEVRGRRISRVRPLPEGALPLEEKTAELPPCLLLGIAAFAGLDFAWEFEGREVVAEGKG